MGASFANVAQAIAAHLAQVPPLPASSRPPCVTCGTPPPPRSRAMVTPPHQTGTTGNPGPGPRRRPRPSRRRDRAGHRRPALPPALALQLPPRNEAEDLAERIGFAELIGPRAPLTAPDCRAGFTLMAPDTFYPLHAHPAIELTW